MSRTCVQSVRITVAESCDFAAVVALLIDPGFGPISASPQWNGIFDKQTTSPSSGDPVWYFDSQSLAAPGGPQRRVAGNENPDYSPFNNLWADNDFTSIFNSFGTWTLAIYTSTVGPSNHFWIGDGPAFGPDPSGIYTYTAGSSVGIAQLKITQTSPGVFCLSLP